MRSTIARVAAVAGLAAGPALATAPDLVIQDLDFDRASNTLTVVVGNIGNDSSNHEVPLGVSVNGGLTEFNLGVLKEGFTATRQLVVPLIEGENVFVAKADHLNVIAESKEGNNIEKETFDFVVNGNLPDLVPIGSAFEAVRCEGVFPDEVVVVTFFNEGLGTSPDLHTVTLSVDGVPDFLPGPVPEPGNIGTVVFPAAQFGLIPGVPAEFVVKLDIGQQIDEDPATGGDGNNAAIYPSHDCF